MINAFRSVREAASQLLCAVLLLSPAIAPASQEALSFSALTLSATAPSREFILTEPVPITLTLTNASGRPVIGHNDLGFTSRRVHASVQRDDGTLMPINQLSPVASFVLIEPKPIAPGAKDTETELTAFELDEIFPRPGCTAFFSKSWDQMGVRRRRRIL